VDQLRQKTSRPRELCRKRATTSAEVVAPSASDLTHSTVVRRHGALACGRSGRPRRAQKANTERFLLAEHAAHRVFHRGCDERQGRRPIFVLSARWGFRHAWPTEPTAAWVTHKGMFETEPDRYGMCPSRCESTENKGGCAPHVLVLRLPDPLPTPSPRSFPLKLLPWY